MDEYKVTEIPIKYSHTIEKELQENLVLSAGEEFLFEKPGIIFIGNAIKQNPSRIAVTNKRVVMLKHKFFGADVLISIPFQAMNRITLENTGGSKLFKKAVKFHYGKKPLSIIITSITRLVASAALLVKPEETEELYELLRSSVENVDFKDLSK